MGNNNATISVNLDRAQPAVYYTGEVISGQILCTVSESTSTPENLHLSVNGLVGYEVLHRSLMQNGQTNQVTDKHDICILRQRVAIGPNASRGQKRNGGSFSRTTVLESGHHEYPFSIRLPDMLPPTIHPKEYPFVRYQLELLVEQKWYVANTYLRYPLRIYPRVNVRHLANALCSVKFAETRNDLTVKGVLDRCALVPGEDTCLSVTVFNPVRLLLKRFDVCIMQRYEIGQCRRRAEIMRVTIPQLANADEANMESTCLLTIPRSVAPSYRFEGRGDRCQVHVSVAYDIKMEVKVKGFFSDFELHVPITIGTDSGDRSALAGSRTTSMTSADSKACETLALEDVAENGHVLSR